MLRANQVLNKHLSLSWVMGCFFKPALIPTMGGGPCAQAARDSPYSPRIKDYQTNPPPALVLPNLDPWKETPLDQGRGHTWKLC